VHFATNQISCVAEEEQVNNEYIAHVSARKIDLVEFYPKSTNNYY